MAKKQNEDALVTQQQGNAALAVAEGADRGDTRGKGEFDQRDLVLPRLAVAQRTSPQTDPDKDSYIAGLKLYEMFNTLTGEIYGRGPVKFAIIRRLPYKAMQFDADNNIVDFDVPRGDPRTQFTTAKEDSSDGKIKAGQRIKPIATEFYEYLGVLVPQMEIVVLSFKSTQVKVAKKLNSFLAFRPGASWMGLYSISSASKQFGAFTAANFTVLPAGPTPAEVVTFADEVFTNTEGKTIDTQRDAAADDTSFNTDEM